MLELPVSAAHKFLDGFREIRANLLEDPTRFAGSQPSHLAQVDQ